MTRSSGRALGLGWTAAAILLYFVAAVPFIATDPDRELSGMATGSLIAAVAFLVAAWAWMLHSAVKGAPEGAVRYRRWAWLVVLILVGLGVMPGTSTIVLPALLLTVPVTFVIWLASRGAVGGWRWVIVPFVSFLLFFSGPYYFGAVLLLIGVTRIPRMAGGYLRELFPRNVGGSL